MLVKRVLFPFAKYQAAGNDFIVIDDRQLRFPTEDSAYIAKLCHRRLGVGADGLVLLQSSERADFRMRIFNADGKEAGQCGNGLRCLVDFIHNNTAAVSPLQIETAGRIVTCTRKESEITVDLGPYTWLGQDARHPPFSFDIIDTGVPHVVVFVDQVCRPDFIEIASRLRVPSALAPEGANVNFAELRDGKLWSRTYERGVEDETLACGTGAAAVAVAAQKKFCLKSPLQVMPASGEELKVEVMDENVRLTGGAVFVFLGSIWYSFPLL